MNAARDPRIMFVLQAASRLFLIFYFGIEFISKLLEFILFQNNAFGSEKLCYFATGFRTFFRGKEQTNCCANKCAACYGQYNV